MAERLGYLPFRATVPGSVWLHAVSVGEVLSATGLLSTLRERMPPGAGLYVSCGTLAGKQAADSKLAGLADGVFYAPLDYVSAVRRVLRGLKPHVVVVLET
ncbi:MAG TPA: glycosyltransferase N-terminal domain-containing protein, partial [Bryobacteraceae bacterium]|nr:glycosyltransferase N-terminal domain-containing protein [Bryobacteraceae bacterium]